MEYAKLGAYNGHFPGAKDPIVTLKADEIAHPENAAIDDAEIALETEMNRLAADGDNSGQYDKDQIKLLIDEKNRKEGPVLESEADIENCLFGYAVEYKREHGDPHFLPVGSDVSYAEEQQIIAQFIEQQS